MARFKGRFIELQGRRKPNIVVITRARTTKDGEVEIWAKGGESPAWLVRAGKAERWHGLLSSPVYKLLPEDWTPPTDQEAEAQNAEVRRQSSLRKQIGKLILDAIHGENTRSGIHGRSSLFEWLVGAMAIRTYRGGWNGRHAQEQP